LNNSTVDETALVILNRQWSRGITIVSSQQKIIFDIQVDRYWPKWQSKSSKLAAKDFETAELYQDMWNRFLMLSYVLADIPWKAISNLELQQSHKALLNKQLLPCTMPFSNIYRREYALTVVAIMNQLPSWHKISLALEGWTTTNKLAIRSVSVYYRDRNWELREDQLASDEVDRLFVSYLKR